MQVICLPLVALSHVRWGVRQCQPFFLLAFDSTSCLWFTVDCYVSIARFLARRIAHDHFVTERKMTWKSCHPLMMKADTLVLVDTWAVMSTNTDLRIRYASKVPWCQKIRILTQSLIVLNCWKKHPWTSVSVLSPSNDEQNVAAERVVKAAGRVVKAAERVIYAAERVIYAAEHVVNAAEHVVIATEHVVTQQSVWYTLLMNGTAFCSKRWRGNVT